MANITVHNEFHFDGFHLDDVTSLIETLSMASPTITMTLFISVVVIDGCSMNKLTRNRGEFTCLSSAHKSVYLECLSYNTNREQYFVFIKCDFAVFNSMNDTGIMSCKNKCLLEINYVHTCINRSFLRKTTSRLCTINITPLCRYADNQR